MAEFNPFDQPNEDMPPMPQTTATPPPQQENPTAPQSAAQEMPPAQSPPQPPEEPIFPDLTPPIHQDPPPQTTPPQPPIEDGAAHQAAKKAPLRILIPGAIVVALLVTFLFSGNALLAKLAPAIAVGRATAKTTKAIESRLADSPYQAFAVLSSTLLSGGKIQGDVSYNDGWSDMQMHFDMAGSLKDAAFEGGFTATSDGTALDARAYMDKEHAALTSSFLDDAWYGVTYKTFEQDLRASVLPDMLELSEEDIREAADVFSELADVLGRDYTDMIGPYSAVLSDFSKGLDWESDTEKTRVGGEKISCSTASVEISDKQLRDLVLSLYDVMADDASVRDVFITSGLANGYMGATREELSREFDIQMRRGRGNLKTSLGQLDGDVQLVYYLNGGRLVKLELSGELNVDGESVEMEYTIDLGRDPAKDDWAANYVFTTDYGDAISGEMLYATDNDGKNFEDALSFSAYDGQTNILMELRNDWNRDTGRLDTDITFDNGYDLQTIRVGSKLTTGKDRFDFELTEIDGVAIASEQGLEFALSCEAGATPSKPNSLNLDQWDAAVMQKFQDAVLAINEARYGGYANVG